MLRIHDYVVNDLSNTRGSGRRAASLLVLALSLTALGVGCSGDGPAGTARADASGEPRVEAAVPAAKPSAPETTANRSSPPPFVADPRTDGGEGFGADTLLAVRYGGHDGYDRLVLDLGVGDEPAGTVPRWTLVSPKGDGPLRVNLPSVSVTRVPDGGAGDGLLKSFHVVRAPEGGLFVDAFSREAFLYRVLELEDPARVAVDFKPADAPLRRPPPSAGGDTVLVEPRAGARISDPLTVSGYSRNFEAANTVTLTNAKGEVLVRRTIAGNDWSSTWGYFEATMDLPSFSGRGTLRVGAARARDGSFRGVEIPVRGQR